MYVSIRNEVLRLFHLLAQIEIVVILPKYVVKQKKKYLDIYTG